MVKNNLKIIFLCSAIIQVMHASSPFSRVQDAAQQIAAPIAKIIVPIATTAAGMHAYTKVKETRAQLEELGQRCDEVEAGRMLYSYNGQRPYEDEEFAQRMQSFLNGFTPYPSELVYAWSYHCMLHTCELSFSAAARRGVPWLQPGDCCVESKKVTYADTVLGAHKIACYNAWLMHCNEAVLYFEQPQAITAERTRVQWHELYYNAQLYAAMIVSGLYAGYMLKSYLWDKKA